MDAQSRANYQPNQLPVPQQPAPGQTVPPVDPAQFMASQPSVDLPFNRPAAAAAPPATNQVSPQPAPTTQPQGADQSDYDQRFEDETEPTDNTTMAAQLPAYLKPQVEEAVYAWQAPSRPFKSRNRRYFTTVITIALLISMILFFAGQFLPIAVVIAVAFLAYVMATIPPHEVTHQFTTYGIRIEDELYYWEELGWFWFTSKYNQRILNVEVVRFPNRLMLLLGDTPEDDIRYMLEAVLVENTPPPTYYEKVAAWIQEKIPLDVE